MSPTQKEAEELLEYACVAAYILEDERDESARNSAERSYRIVVAKFLFQILSCLGVLRTLAFSFLGLLLGALLTIALIG